MLNYPNHKFVLLFHHDLISPYREKQDKAEDKSSAKGNLINCNKRSSFPGDIINSVIKHKIEDRSAKSASTRGI